jgi:hypothetical protein
VNAATTASALHGHAERAQTEQDRGHRGYPPRLTIRLMRPL